LPRVCAAVGVSAFLLASCASESTDPVPVATASPTTARSDAACALLDQALPETVLDQVQRPTTPQSPTTAAWGDPEIVLTCGVGRPAARAPGAQLFDIQGITWFAEELTAGTRFTSEGRIANVRVDVPDDYRPEAEALIDLAPAINATIPVLNSAAN
jgi:hypothetical protein